MPPQGIITSSSQFLRTTSLIPCSSFPRTIRAGFLRAAGELKKSTEEYIKSFGPLKKQLASAKREAEDLAGQFAALSRAEQQSAFGKELKGKVKYTIVGGNVVYEK